ncbi:MAG: phosphotransferase [Acidobacteria bacterium]|nr:phosphotransferase [Acidobacteriota bacterium]
MTRLQDPHYIASLFDVPEPLEVSVFSGRGNINRQTYLVKAGPPGSRNEYLLQLLNPDVFRDPEAVMRSMILCIKAQRKALSEGALQTVGWEPPGLVPTREGDEYLRIIEETGIKCWRMMPRIADSLSFRSLQEISRPESRVRIAEQAGRGLAIFGILTSGMDPSSIVPPLAGYRDTRLYYNQLASVLSGCRSVAEAEPYLPEDPSVLRSTKDYFLIRLEPEAYHRRLNDPQLRRFIDLAGASKDFGLTLANGLASGELRQVVIHGDTKLENFLFSEKTGHVKALVDLDTIMPHTWLSDWGDMVRSLVNIAGEREEDPDRISVDMDIFDAIARGFLSTVRTVDDREIELMAAAPQMIALELGVRFLADYLRGDSYFQLGHDDPPELNRTRAIAQFCLFERLRGNESAARRCIQSMRDPGRSV